jgi:hypothetical protein
MAEVMRQPIPQAITEIFSRDVAAFQQFEAFESSRDERDRREKFLWWQVARLRRERAQIGGAVPVES